MKYIASVKAVVEADSADTAKAVIANGSGVTYVDIDVKPYKRWSVTVSVPVIYTFDLRVNAENEVEAEAIASREIEWLSEIEAFVQQDVVNDYQYDVEGSSGQVQTIEALEDDGEGASAA
jgi:hypothetical protein